MTFIFFNCGLFDSTTQLEILRQVVSDGFSPGFFDGLTSEAWQLLRLAADHPAASCLGTLGRGRTMGWLDWSTEDHQRATHGDEVKIVVIFPETDIGTPQK